jgi:hypothetical protein
VRRYLNNDNGAFFEISDAVDVGPASPIFQEPDEAFIVLERFQEDPSNLVALRHLYAEAVPLGGIRNLHSREVLVQVAQHCAVGAIKLAPPTAFRRSQAGGGRVARSEPATEAEPPPEEEGTSYYEEPAPIVEPEPVVEPGPRDEEAVDAVVQAAALRQAADAGIPFCEECEKGRQRQALQAGAREPIARAAAPPVAAPRPVVEEKSVAAAQASALKAAAATGAPCCEECEEARQKQASPAETPAPAPQSVAAPSAPPTAPPVALPAPAAEEKGVAAAQASALKAAAAVGAPCREECEEARQKQATAAA